MLTLTRQISREILTALSVLALVLLAFAPHAAASSDIRAISANDLAAFSFCGDAPTGQNDRAQSPCHACRSALATLPSPPLEAEPAHAGFIVSVRPLSDDFRAGSVLAQNRLPRAPPMSV